jgi:arylsulfatase
VPIFRGGTREGHEALYWEHEGNRAVRRNNWKIVSDWPRGWELYDLDADRTETRNLALKNQDKVRELSRMYHAWAEHCNVEPWNPLSLAWHFVKSEISSPKK